MSQEVYDWRVSEANKTLYSGVKLRIGDICLYMCGHTYVICTLTLSYFCVNSGFNLVLKFTRQNPLVYRSLPVSS